MDNTALVFRGAGDKPNLELDNKKKIAGSVKLTLARAVSTRCLTSSGGL